MALFVKSVPAASIATFRSDFEYEIEYEYDFRISKPLRSRSPRFSLLLTSRGECEVNDIHRTDHNQKPATRNSKVAVILNLVLVVRSEGRHKILKSKPVDERSQGFVML